MHNNWTCNNNSVTTKLFNIYVSCLISMHRTINQLFIDVLVHLFMDNASYHWVWVYRSSIVSNVIQLYSYAMIPIGHVIIVQLQPKF